ncbi:UreF-domain-containing protein [Protomyces lactucae-debilis]|uniref:UreF-domain-containing protein n=1 Tax=Protomyces lactucae-debilis TaxID=2754530 RepID=A0A1Y2FUF1_PROLT|nr:UreF-domain-containing protein [Protomyces lactucae-debilis]ORY87651.1 UreF-domain-containing protein [Protomyces lactucae-debilis]
MLEEAENHYLLILSDSALPIGSFAYSSGLESFCHHQRQAGQHDAASSFLDFLYDSLRSITTTTMPFLRAAYREPERCAELDDLFDANTPCVVARRCSIAQGRALLKLLERVFVEADPVTQDASLGNAVVTYRRAITKQACSGHFGVAYGLTGRVLGIGIDKLVYTFLHAHVKAVLSAAVRLSLIGPYESTHILASRQMREALTHAAKLSEAMSTDDCVQTFAMLDVYQGRHELLYSRIFSA